MVLSYVQGVRKSKQLKLSSHFLSFFKDQFIESFGCEDYTSGKKMTKALIEKKLQILFSKQTPNDNKPYDNYVVFFSGMADCDGSWILSGDIFSYILNVVGNLARGVTMLFNCNERKTSMRIIISVLGYNRKRSLSTYLESF